MERRSDISGFHELPIKKRLEIVRDFAGLTKEEARVLEKAGSLEIKTADMMIENVIGTTGLPLGIATNFLINGRDYLIPMAIEEPSVVAAASYAAKLARAGGGFTATSTEPIMTGQVQLVNVKNPEKAARDIIAKKQEMVDYANKIDPCVMVKFGGGLRDIETRVISTPAGKMVIVHLLVDCRDAMGANAVNTLAETLAPMFEDISGGKARLRIISNLADKRLARARAVWKKEVLEQSTKGLMKGEDVVNAIIEAWAFGFSDPYRAATHNKGIMNGVDAVVLATGNDWRAVEAGAHSYASLRGRYTTLTKYYRDNNGDLVGEIEMPIAVGLVGGATKTHPVAKIALKILGVKTAKELSEVIASVGLAQNFAALRALATEGIQKGHMRLHARNIAVMAGAKGDEIERVASRMAQENKIRVDRAKEILDEIRKGT
ncbi:MAG: hydroxymethylglutaryl-CoA reductase, degradative [Candidatus Aenigmatarchaeota archaeon]